MAQLRPDLVGQLAPRVATPRRGATTEGPRAAALAAVAGLDLMPWQRLALDRMLEVDGTGQLQHTEVGILVGRGNGKTKLLAARVLYGLLVQGWDTLGVAANNRELARELWGDVVRMVTDSPLSRYLAEPPRKANGSEQLAVRSLTGDVARYRIGAATGGSARGFRARLLVVDELRELTQLEPYAAITGVQAGLPGRTQRVLPSTAGDAASLVLNALRDRGRAAAADPALHPRLCWLEWSAAPGAPVTDPAAWAAANPALGMRVSAEHLAAESAAAPETVFRTEYLNQWVDVMAAAVPPGVWAAAERDVPLGRGWPAVIGVELAPDRGSAAVVLAARDPGGVAHLRLLAHAEAEPGATVDPAELAAATARLWREHHASTVAADSWQGRPVLDQLAALRIPVAPTAAGQLSLATAGLLAGLVAGRVAHDGDQVLTAHVLAAGTKPSGDGGQVLSRRASTGPMAGAVAAAVALHQLAAPAAPTARIVLPTSASA